VHIGFLRKALADEICRWLDGIPFAIELVAGRAGAYGIRGIVNLLNEQMDLIWQGRRSALPRQQTLQAMLDWSYDLLSECEQRILRRLSVFADVFALDAAQWWRCYSGGRRTLRAQAEHLRDRKGYVVHCSKLTWT
jgi:predicted ATPase